MTVRVMKGQKNAKAIDTPPNLALGTNNRLGIPFALGTPG